MLRKYALIISVLAVLGAPSIAKAQTTMDVAMKIQAILDQLSEIRSGLKQVQSSMNIETMLQNLGGAGDWKAMLKNAAGGIFDKNAEKGGTKQALLLLPDGLADKADDPEASMDWIEENFLQQKENASPEEVAALTKKKNMLPRLLKNAIFIEICLILLTFLLFFAVLPCRLWKNRFLATKVRYTDAEQRSFILNRSPFMNPLPIIKISAAKIWLLFTALPAAYRCICPLSATALALKIISSIPFLHQAAICMKNRLTY